MRTLTPYLRRGPASPQCWTWLDGPEGDGLAHAELEDRLGAQGRHFLIDARTLDLVP